MTEACNAHQLRNLSVTIHGPHGPVGRPSVGPHISQSTCGAAFTPPPRPSNNAHVQAALGVGSVNFRSVDFGGALFNWSHSVLCVLSDALVLRCTMFIFGVKEADLGMMA